MKIYHIFMGLIFLCLISLFTKSVFAQEINFIPTTYEQFMLELINRDRADPDAAVIRYGIPDLNDNLPPGTISHTPKQPLAFNVLLQGAASFHSNWMLDTDTFAHAGLGGLFFYERAELFGYGTFGTFGTAENIGWLGQFPTTPDMEQSTLDLQEGYFRDDGQPSAGHRQNIMTDELKETGIGTKPGQFFADEIDWNAVISTQDFTYKFDNPFITGVVYDDLDGNNFFTPFEELFPVVVVAISQTNGQIFFINSPLSPINLPSGGYAIQVPSDTYTVGAFAGVLVDPIIHTDVVVGSENVKVDFIPVAAAAREGLGSVEGSTGGGGLVSDKILKLSENPPAFLPE